MNIFQKQITPDKPRVLAEEQIYVYVPVATSTNAGIAMYNKTDFDVIGSEVSLKWPAESFAQGPIETPSIVKVLDNEFEYTGKIVELLSGNSRIESDKLEIQLKRVLRDAYERPELVQLDPTQFNRTIVERDGKQYYKYGINAILYNTAQSLSSSEQLRARQNIGASSSKYVDSVLEIAEEARDKANNAVMLDGDQNIAGIKTFVNIPVLPLVTPTNSNQAVTKKYVDDTTNNLSHIYLKRTDIVNKLTSHDTNKPLSANMGRMLAEGKSGGKSFTNIEEMVNFLNDTDTAVLMVSTNLFIVQLNVPDFWITDDVTDYIPYTYTTDEDLINEVNIAPVQIGHYKISKLETTKVDLEDYYTKNEIDSQMADKADISDLVKSHNELSGIQGGAGGEYYHLTSAQANNLLLTTPQTLTTAQQNQVKTNLDIGGGSDFSGSFNDLTDVPTTLTGYGITDAVTTDTTQTITGAKIFTTPPKNYNNGFAGGLSASASSGGGAVGYNTKATSGGGAVGYNAVTTGGGAVGQYAKTGNGFAGGYNAKAVDANDNAINAIQLGTGTNSVPKSLRVYNYQLMNADGSIPGARLTDTLNDKFQVVADEATAETQSLANPDNFYFYEEE